MNQGAGRAFGFVWGSDLTPCRPTFTPTFCHFPGCQHCSNILFPHYRPGCARGTRNELVPQGLKGADVLGLRATENSHEVTLRDRGSVEERKARLESKLGLGKDAKYARRLPRAGTSPRPRSLSGTRYPATLFFLSAFFHTSSSFARTARVLAFIPAGVAGMRQRHRC